MPKTYEKNATPIEPPKDPFEPCEGIEIFSRGTENLQEQYVEALKRAMTSFYDKAGLSELMFLFDAIQSWQNYAGVITRRCLIADVLLDKLGDSREGFRREKLRYYESGKTAQAEAMGVK